MEHARIAICISGQVRSPLSMLHRIAEEAALCHADVFISVWSQVGQKTFEGAVGPKNIRRIMAPEVARQLPEHWLGRMKVIFPDFARFFPKHPPIAPDVLADIFSGAEIEVEDDGPQFAFAAADSNSLRMLHRIWRANQMKQAAERARGQRYEKVLRLRPDMLFSGVGLANLPIGENQLFVQGHAGNRADYLNDTIWAARSESDDAIAALYQRCKTVNPDEWDGIHRELAAAAKGAGLVPAVIRIIKPVHERADQAHDAHIKAVGQNLLAAIAKGELAQDQAGGPAFCALVAAVTQARGLPDNTMELLDNVEQENRNAYQHALVYLSNICLQNESLPVADRMSLLVRVLHYYSFQKAEGHLEVRITELPEVFASEAMALQGLVVQGVSLQPAPQTPLPKILAARFDTYWAARIKGDHAALAQDIRRRLLSSPKFIIDLHRMLTQTSAHQAGYDLGRVWADFGPNNWKAYDLMAGSARALGDDTRALAAFDEAEANGAAHARLAELKGNFLLRLQQPAAAISAYEQALGLKGGNPARIEQGLAAARKKLNPAEG